MFMKNMTVEPASKRVVVRRAVRNEGSGAGNPGKRPLLVRPLAAHGSPVPWFRMEGPKPMAGWTAVLIKKQQALLRRPLLLQFLQSATVVQLLSKTNLI